MTRYGAYKLAALGCAAAFLALVYNAQAAGQSAQFDGSRAASEAIDQSLRARYKADATPLVAQYRADDGSLFVLDQSLGDTALLRMADGGEVWALRSVARPGGGAIFKSDIGRDVVRMDAFGNLTFYSEEHPKGVPATAIGPGRSMPAQPEAELAAARALLGLDVLTVEPALEEAAPSLAADAALVIGHALEALPVRVAGIELVLGEEPQAAFAGETLRVTVAPALGYAGRPSSAAIRRTIEDALLQSQMDLLSVDLDGSAAPLPLLDREQAIPASALSFSGDE